MSVNNTQTHTVSHRRTPVLLHPASAPPPPCRPTAMGGEAARGRSTRSHMSASVCTHTQGCLNTATRRQQVVTTCSGGALWPDPGSAGCTSAPPHMALPPPPPLTHPLKTWNEEQASTICAPPAVCALSTRSPCRFVDFTCSKPPLPSANKKHVAAPSLVMGCVTGQAYSGGSRSGTGLVPKHQAVSRRPPLCYHADATRAFQLSV